MAELVTRSIFLQLFEIFQLSSTLLRTALENKVKQLVQQLQCSGIPIGVSKTCCGISILFCCSIVPQGNLDFTDSAQHGLMTQLLRLDITFINLLVFWKYQFLLLFLGVITARLMLSLIESLSLPNYYRLAHNRLTFDFIVFIVHHDHPHNLPPDHCIIITGLPTTASPLTSPAPPLYSSWSS